MKVENTRLPDVKIIIPSVYKDSRGYFFESYNRVNFNNSLLDINFLQDNESRSEYGTLRGLHYQLAPFAQTKLVRVSFGSVLDIAVDIRKGSPTFGEYVSVELSAENKKQLFVPRGFAHGFIVKSDFAIFNYKVDNYYSKEHERGIIYSDSDLAIDWQVNEKDIQLSEKDIGLPLFADSMTFSYTERLYE